MRLHPRHFPVSEAKNELSQALTRTITKHDLTYAEIWTILNEVGASWAKYARRDERHPNDPDTGAEEE